MKDLHDTISSDEQRKSGAEIPSRSQKSSGVSGSMVLKTIFGIFMIIVYVGMGVLLFINFFEWSPSWAWLRWLGGSLFVVYGLWRAYRQIKGIDSPY